MKLITPESIAAARARLGVPDEHFPASVAIIMDGNGRWAKKRGVPRPFGHQAGADKVHDIVRIAAHLGLDALMLYSFSSENWKRPRREVDLLMRLYAERMRIERPTIMGHNIRVRHLGRRKELPDEVLREIDETVQLSSGNDGMCLALAINYGSRAEITDAVADIARRVAEGTLRPDDIDENLIADSLDTSGVPDPDLLIRTAGEMRLSNFLLWQLSYAEFYVTDVYWPDFDEGQFHKALRSYAGRQRRFGGLDEDQEA